MNPFRSLRRSVLSPCLPGLSLIALSILMASCGSGSESTRSSKTVVTCMTFEWGTGEDSYRERERLFNEQSDDVELKFVYVPSDSYVTKLMASTAGGIMPDLVYSMTGRHKLFIHKGMFQPLNSLIEGPDGIDLSDFNSILIREQLSIGDEIYAIPSALNCLALYYNRDPFEKAGIPLPSDTEPMTWDEYRAIAKKLTVDLDGDGRVDQYGCAPGFDNMQPSYFFFVLNQTFGATAFSPDGRTAYLNAPETIEVFQYLHKLVHEDKSAPDPAVGQTLGPALFNSGRLGMFINGPWFGYEISQTRPDLHYVAAPLPRHEGKPRRNMIGGPSIGISKSCKHPEAAWKVLKFLVSEEFQRLPIQGLPSRRSVVESEGFNGLPQWDVFLRELEFADPSFFIEEYNAVATMVSQYGERILCDPEGYDRIPERLNELNEKVNAHLRK